MNANAFAVPVAGKSPVVLMSTYDLEDLPTGAADCGATAYLHKEDLSADLLSRLWQRS